MSNAGLNQSVVLTKEADQSADTISESTETVTADEPCVAIAPITNLDDSSLSTLR